MKTITMTNEEKNNIAVGTEVVATHDMGAYSAGDILIITQQDYDYMPAAIKKGDDEKFGGMYIHVDDFEVLDTSTIADDIYKLKYQVRLTEAEQLKRSLPEGTRVRLTTELGPSPGLQVGCEGCIVEQDGSCMPRVMLDGFLYAKGLHVRTEGFEAIPEEQPVEVTQDNLAFGQVYKVLDNTVGGADEGDLLVLKRNDGTACPFFYKLSDPDLQVCAWLEALVAVNVIESKQSKELGA